MSDYVLTLENKPQEGLSRYWGLVSTVLLIMPDGENIKWLYSLLKSGYILCLSTSQKRWQLELLPAAKQTLIFTIITMNRITQ